MSPLFPLVATSGGGVTVLIDDVDGFHAFRRGREIGERFHLMARIWDHRTYAHVERDVTHAWIVRDDAGRIVAPDAFGPAPIVRRGGRNRDFVFRDGPVPGLVRRRWGTHDAPRKRHGGRGVAIRIRVLHTGDPLADQMIED